MHRKLFSESLARLGAILNSHESIDGLACELIRYTYYSCFGDGVVLDERGLDLSGREAVARDIDDVVDTTTNPVEALMIAACAVTSELQYRKRTIHDQNLKAGKDVHNNPCTRSNRCPYSAYGLHKLYAPCLAKPA